MGTARVNAHLQQALRYVRNTNGNATRAHFVEDFEPIGDRLWDQLSVNGLIRTNESGHVVLTPEGEKSMLEDL